ncbi:DNA helicase II [Thioflexithrix psekupsensis]|uniref:DNA 3'-5' helicase n=1 Tax=Thioflexithrix psekupsensis TaxID=1570016 RepID=A0A251X5C1_9GAMM|nr:DNA helicase II [Thioflexithrix psekupsensis]OUD12586.1 DNA helicase II [Thioflexithrix psekupsensis]
MNICDDASLLLNDLNTAQREAVAAPETHVLVLAGAGSGKTRVLVHRIAWLLQCQLARANHILAVTFTNRAANEMRDRIQKLLGYNPSGLLTGTFHGIAYYLLRQHWQLAQLPETFQILDSDEQLRLIKRIIKEAKIDDKVFSPKKIQQFINACKEKAQRAQSVVLMSTDRETQAALTVYQFYEQTCQQSGLVDFTELLLKTYELLRDDESLRKHYQTRFKHILVDEFQDTNYLQYEWLKLIAGPAAKLFIVGDDDQSIYSWRGARIENIQLLPVEFKETLLIRLEQNYRSTKMILTAANAVIRNNKNRLGKELWTNGTEGDPLFLYKAHNEINEAEFIVHKIKLLGKDYHNNAILYRTSSQSRVLEEALIDQQIPYRIYGGMRFYERAEIKDVLAYLRLAVYSDDDAAFERIINTPKRGIGERTIEPIRALARQQGISLWRASRLLLADNGFKGRAAKTITEFLHYIESLIEQTHTLLLSDLIKKIIETCGLPDFYLKDNKEEGQRRIENLAELISAARQFEIFNRDEEKPILTFLAHATLDANNDNANETNHVQLMTLHLAKGLEFKRVFLCGLEEGLFPHQNSLDEGNVEEERRLCYVGITRAREQLYLSHAETRYYYGERSYSRASRFIREIPAELIDHIRFNNAPNYQANVKNKNEKFAIGTPVLHHKFGRGIIVDKEGQGEFTRIQVDFSENDCKWIILAYSDIELL